MATPSTSCHRSLLVTVKAGARPWPSWAGPAREIAFLGRRRTHATVKALREQPGAAAGPREFEALSARALHLAHAHRELARRVAEANVSRAPRPTRGPHHRADLRARSELPAAFIVGLTGVPAQPHAPSCAAEMARRCSCLGSHRQRRGDAAAQCARGQIDYAVRRRAELTAGRRRPSARRPRARRRMHRATSSQCVERLARAAAARRATPRPAARTHGRSPAGALARRPQHRHASPAWRSTMWRCRAALRFINGNRARPRRLRRRRLLRGHIGSTRR